MLLREVNESLSTMSVPFFACNDRFAGQHGRFRAGQSARVIWFFVFAMSRYLLGDRGNELRERVSRMVRPMTTENHQPDDDRARAVRARAGGRTGQAEGVGHARADNHAEDEDGRVGVAFAAQERPAVRDSRPPG